MTQKQKEQLAKEYAENEYKIGDAAYDKAMANLIERVYLDALDARDDEFALLKAEIEDDNAVMMQLRAELEKAKNPWINVEDNLPDSHTPVYAKNDERTWFFALRTGNRVRPWYDIVGRHPEEVTHWKPIQPLKGGNV